ncbi:MAG: hypothetical protein MK212_09110 [Saprospiraceae bacterium]|nr:hypothetical protein [Saprospiraceae bacterium]
MHHLKNIIFPALFLCFLTNASAQLADSGSEFLKPFKAKLAKSHKVEATPILPNIDNNDNNDINYIVPTRLVEVDYPDPKIRLKTYEKEPPPKHYGLYSKLGIGYPISPYVELSYHSNASDKIKYGLGFRHHSGRGNLDFQRFHNNEANLFATYYTNSVAIGGALGFNLDGVHFYGFNQNATDTTARNKEDVYQRFMNIRANIHAFNGKMTRGDFNYRGDLNFDIFNDRYQASEFTFAPKFGIEKFFGNQNKMPLKVDLGFHINNFSDSVSTDTSNSTRFLSYLHPTFGLKFGGTNAAFKAHLGTNLGLSEGQFFIFPDLELEASVLKGQLNIYGGWTGRIRTNTFHSLTDYNPFIVSTMNMRHTKWQEFYGGVRGNIQGIGYNIKVGYALTKDLPLFLNDSLSGYDRFTVLYDTVNIFNIKGSLDFNIIKDLHLLTTVGFNAYNTTAYSKAYHLPGLETNVALIYKLHFDRKNRNKNILRLKAEFFLNSGVPYFNEVTRQDEVLAGLFDFNFGASYYFTENIGVFVDVNNIINNKNQRWHRYQQIGFNAMVGAMIKFDTNPKKGRR